MSTYRVVVTRDGNAWLAELPELDGAATHARTLSALDQAVREVVVLMADLPDEAMPTLVLCWEYRTGVAEVDDLAPQVRRLRERARRVESEATAETEKLAGALVGLGFSVRDTAAMLAISSQRVSQMTARAS